MYLLTGNMFEVSNLRHTEASGVVLGYGTGPTISMRGGVISILPSTAAALMLRAPDQRDGSSECYPAGEGGSC